MTPFELGQLPRLARLIQGATAVAVVIDDNHLSGRDPANVVIAIDGGGCVVLPRVVLDRLLRGLDEGQPA